MRLFITTPLPDVVSYAIQNQQMFYQQEGVRLVPPGNLHLTLHFLGETPALALPDIRAQLQIIAAHQVPFALMLKEIAPGPKLKAPRLVWARFYNHAVFTQLVRAVQQALHVSPEPTGDYIPHITMARLLKEKKFNLHLPVRQVPGFPPFVFRQFSIWQSELGSPHPHYSILENFALKPAAE